MRLYLRVALPVFVASVCLGAHAGEMYYVSDSPSVESLYQACLKTLEPTGVHCVKDRDYTDPTGSQYRSRLDALYGAPAYKAMQAAASAYGDRHQLEALRFKGTVPQSEDGKEYFVFLVIYRMFEPYSTIPVVKADGSIWIFDPRSTGARVGWSDDVDRYVDSHLLAIPMKNIASKDATPILVRLADQVTKQQQDAKNRESDAKTSSTPSCTSVVVNGYAAIWPSALVDIYRSQNPTDVAARNPLQCMFTAWGGTPVAGGMANENHKLECKGIVPLSNHSGDILDWTPETYRIKTDIDMDTGRQSLVLFVRRQDSICRN